MGGPLWREAVGRELRAVRREKHRTLAEVAADANVSMPYLSEIERGRKEPSSEVLGSVCRALDLRLVDLTTRVSRSLMTGPMAPPAARPVARPRGELCLAA